VLAPPSLRADAAVTALEPRVDRVETGPDFFVRPILRSAAVKAAFATRQLCLHLDYLEGELGSAG
jgi:hypothetical protein